MTRDTDILEGDEPPWSLERFRSEFPALTDIAWLDTPGCPPAAATVANALRGTVDAWESGHFSWTEWDSHTDLARQGLARLLHVDPDDVALIDSLAAAAATVAQSLRSGSHVLVDREEFRSNLFPWTARAAHGDIDVVYAPTGTPENLSDRLCSSLTEDIDLVAVSSVLSSSGVRSNLSAVAAAAHAVGARIFVNVTQSFGVLQHDLNAPELDFVAAHGYKWMLAPRGCAWLYARHGCLDDIAPLAPGWHTVEHPNTDYFGSHQPWSTSAQKLDGALPWLPWLGGIAAISILEHLDPAGVQRQATELAHSARTGLRDMGIRVQEGDEWSHIVRMFSSECQDLISFLSERAVRVSGGPTSLRFGFHGFNNHDDLQRLLDGVAAWMRNRGVDVKP